MGKKQANSEQTFKSVAGYKWTRKSAIFGQVTEKSLTIDTKLSKNFELGLITGDIHIPLALRVQY